MLENVTLLHGQAVRLCDDRDDVDDLAELLHHNDINGAETVPSRIDEEQAAMDTGVLDVSVTHSSELLAQVRAVLVLDVFDNRIPASRGRSVQSVFSE